MQSGLRATLAVFAITGVAASPALAETHPFLEPLGGSSSPDMFTNPNGIAVEESTGDVYVAQLGTSAQQTISIQGGPEGGGFTLEFNGKKTSALSVSGTSAPSAEAVQTALRELSTIGPANTSNVTVAEEGALPSTVTYTVSFQGELATVSLPQLACDGSALTGGTSPACAVATTVPGVDSKVSKFDASGNPIESWGTKGTLNGGTTTAGSFAIPNAPGNPAAIAVDDSCAQQQPALSGSACEAFDPSFGDLYVMDAGHNVIDKFNAAGETLKPITGPFEGELLGLGVDATGDVLVDVQSGGSASDVFDNSPANSFVTYLQLEGGVQSVAPGAQQYGFAAAGESGDGYFLLSCGCTEKTGPNGEQLGTVGPGSVAAPAAGVAAAVDPATGHVYLDEQTSVTEWDTGQMNGTPESGQDTGSLVSSFGSPQLTSSSGQGGIAVDGASGRIYVSNPAAGNVYVFASTAPAAAAAPATGVTKTEATLHATVNPNGGELTSCKFEYDTSPSNNLTVPIARLDHSVPCEQTPEQIGAGDEPVAVGAHVIDLQPGSLYRFRLVAANAAGVAPSSGLFPTAAPGFGIKNFEVAFLNQDGTPDTQAGSHPYKLVNNIEFNTQVIRKGVHNLTYIAMPAGNVKDVTVDLPPGFIGDPNATAKKCTLEALSEAGLGDNCPAESEIGSISAEVNGEFNVPGLYPEVVGSGLLSIVPPPGVAFQMAGHILVPNAFIDVGLPAGGDSGLSATAFGLPVTAPVFKSLLTVYGVPPNGATAPLLTMPTACNGPLTSTISADSYQEPGQFATASSVTRDAEGAPAGMSGCAKLLFPPAIEVKPDVPDASSSSGLTVGVHVSQKAALNPNGLAESGVRDLTVTLPEGVAINPADADGLEACSEGLAGFTGFAEFNSANEPGDKTATFTPELPEPPQPGANFCPTGSKIGTVRIKTPLLEHELEGAVYLAAQNANPFGNFMALYLIAEDPVSGTIIKQTGEISLTAAGQIVTTFKNLPDDPFEEAELHFFGGERAPLSTPTRCGTYTTQASFVPWDGNGPVNTSSSFQITSGPNGSPCPGASLPFSPSLAGGATNIQAGAFSPFTLTMSRKDGEQNLQSVEAHLPPGLSGILSNIELCPEPHANEGKCGPNSLIGETTVSVGVGGDPFTVSGGKFYLTGPYNGSGGCTVGQQGCAPFGITFEVPAKAGPFDLERNSANPAGEDPCDCVLVRGKIEINPVTAALTITSNPPGTPDAIPTSIEGIPLEIQHINAITTRGNFQFNPTNCNKMEVTGTIRSGEGGLDTIGVPFQVANCAALKFEPKLSVSTSGKTSKADGASLTAKVTYPNVPQGTDADLATVKVDLPKQLPSRLTTLQKACTAKQFEADPARCPAESNIGYAVVHTPILPVPLVGPAIFVSHGGEAFPSLTMVLQGDGVTIDLVGTTFISRAGITSTTFKTVPDQPFSSFELTLPEGKYSALAAIGDLCTSKLAMPTAFIAQNGAEIHESTPISVTGCAKVKALTRAQKLAKALNACHKKKGSKRSSCEKAAHKRYGPIRRKKR